MSAKNCGRFLINGSLSWIDFPNHRGDSAWRCGWSKGLVGQENAIASEITPPAAIPGGLNDKEAGAPSIAARSGWAFLDY
jgi:hypothetical protein